MYRRKEVIPQEVVEAFFAACKSGNFDLANKEVNNVIAEGYPVSQMFSQLFEIIVAVDDLSDEQKARMCRKLGEADKCLVDGADEYLQLLDVAATQCELFVTCRKNSRIAISLFEKPDLVLNTDASDLIENVGQLRNMLQLIAHWKWSKQLYMG